MNSSLFVLHSSLILGNNILNLILRTILLVLNLQIGILIYICEIYGLWRTCTCAEYEGNHVALALDLVSLIEPLLSLNFLALGNLVAWPLTRSGQVLVRTVAPCPEVETAGPAHLVGIGIHGNIVWLEGCRLASPTPATPPSMPTKVMATTAS